MACKIRCNQTQHSSGIATFGLVCPAPRLLLALCFLFHSKWRPMAGANFPTVDLLRFFPLWSAALLFILSAALLLRSRRRLVGSEPAKRTMSYRLLGVFAAFAVAGVALFWLGFLLAAGALIVALCALFGERRRVHILALALFVPLAIHGLFRSLLNVLLPVGGF